MFIDAELIAALVALTALTISGVYAFAKLGNRVDNLERDVSELKRDVKALRQEVKELHDLVLVALYGQGRIPPHLMGLMPPAEEVSDG